jgi:hypothetical protein
MKILRHELHKIAERACERTIERLTPEQRRAVQEVVDTTNRIAVNIGYSNDKDGQPVGCLLTQARDLIASATSPAYIWGTGLGFAFDNEMELAGYTHDQGRSYVFEVQDITWTGGPSL